MKRLPIFYAPPEKIGAEQAILDRTESGHLVKVLRLKKGAMVLVVDGLGMAYQGEVDRVGKNEAVIRLHSTTRNFGEPSARLTLAAGISTGDKFDSVVQKGTELGVKRFVPIISERTTVSITDPKRQKSRVRRLEKVALSAMKQTRRAYRPDIATPTKFADFLKETEKESLNLIFHPSPAGAQIAQLKIPTETKRVSILIGPESGFSDEEAAQAAQAGYQVVSLGARVLRTETAGPVACALVMNALGEFS